ncbi:Carboxypeptidase [Mycena sanguinolenta]|uniref:carboxypeptidase C n=1 Tax=Mycena sanguinolenta TaxID=230812 RepID=A0A8H7D9Q1_9AGAR|nr:Carboxypeptidase [Mycena sanguinolenta]
MGITDCDCAADDVGMSVNGGPGCSSAMGLLMELNEPDVLSFVIREAYRRQNASKPVQDRHEERVDEQDGVEPALVELGGKYFLRPAGCCQFLSSLCIYQSRAHIWSRRVGVGFSYAYFGETIETTEDAAKNVYAFISLFFQSFGQFKGRGLHLSGESYGVRPTFSVLPLRVEVSYNDNAEQGRYLPVFASFIYDQNQLATAAGRPTLNLQSVLIGNGITDISTLYPGRYDIECALAALEVPFQSISTCVRMKAALPRCQKLMQAGCIGQFDAINSRAAVNFCDNEPSSGMPKRLRHLQGPHQPLLQRAVPGLTIRRADMCIGHNLYSEQNQAIAKYLSDPAVIRETALRRQPAPRQLLRLRQRRRTPLLRPPGWTSVSPRRSTTLRGCWMGVLRVLIYAGEAV